MRMPADINAGLTSALIVWDMRRFGINCPETGLYSETHFPEKNVRDVAVNRNVDSENPTEKSSLRFGT